MNSTAVSSVTSQKRFGSTVTPSAASVAPGTGSSPSRSAKPRSISPLDLGSRRYVKTAGFTFLRGAKDQGDTNGFSAEAEKLDIEFKRIRLKDGSSAVIQVFHVFS